MKSASFSASITVASLCVRRASSSWPSRASARPYIREARSSGRWTRYSALPAPSDGYIDSSATNAGRRCRVSPQPRPVQGSRPDPALCHLSDISDRSCPRSHPRAYFGGPHSGLVWFALLSAETPVNGLASSKQQTARGRDAAIRPSPNCPRTPRERMALSSTVPNVGRKRNRARLHCLRDHHPILRSRE